MLLFLFFFCVALYVVTMYWFARKEWKSNHWAALAAIGSLTQAVSVSAALFIGLRQIGAQRDIARRQRGHELCDDVRRSLAALELPRLQLSGHLKRFEETVLCADLAQKNQVQNYSTYKEDFLKIASVLQSNLEELDAGYRSLIMSLSVLEIDECVHRTAEIVALIAALGIPPSDLAQVSPHVVSGFVQETRSADDRWEPVRELIIEQLKTRSNRWV